MKNFSQLAAALMISGALADESQAADKFDYGKMIADRLMEYAGLGGETTAVDLAGKEDTKSPRVMAFGYETASSTSNGLLGYELGLNMDLGWSYELPLYNQDEYLVFRQRGAVYAGGRNYFSFTLYAVRLYIFLDLWLGKATAENYLRYDVVNYGDFCNAAQYLIDLARASLLFQIDVNECVWGLIGSLTSDTQDCEWGTYYINQPLIDYQPFKEQMKGELLGNSCGGPIPQYDG